MMNPMMSKYTFVADPWGFEIVVREQTEQAAHTKAWNLMSQAHKDSCEDLECVDCQPIS